MLRLVVEGRDYDLCVGSASDMSCNNNKGAFGKGLNNTARDPRGVERTGRLGEMAFCRYLGVEPDLSYIEGGDKQDVIWNNLTMDIKIAFSGRNGCCFVKMMDEWGNLISIHNDVYIFGYKEMDNFSGRSAVINVVGYLTNAEVKQQPVRIGRKGRGHYNYECYFAITHPIEEFFGEKYITLPGGQSTSHQILG